MEKFEPISSGDEMEHAEEASSFSSFLRVVAGFTAAASLVLYSPASAQGKTFDFLGFRTDATAAPISELSGKRCRVAPVGLSKCTLYAGAVLGRARPLDLTVTFNNAHMVSVTGWVVRSFYGDLIDAFITKYGLPDTTETRPWQNQIGLTFDNTVQTWRFEDGNLELRQHGNTRDIAEFSFLANRNLPEQPVRQPPPVNF